MASADEQPQGGFQKVDEKAMELYQSTHEVCIEKEKLESTS